jgi:hypothetical protein
VSNLGKWDSLYKDLSVVDRASHPIKFGDGITYRIAAAFLADVQKVEDWGCGTGGFKEFCSPEYVGIDGSKSPFADRVADLIDYRSQVPGIHLRHVLEHNYDWEIVLANAVASAEQKLCVCLFTPFATTTREIAFNTDVDVPVLSLPRRLIEKHFHGHSWQLLDNIPTETEYGLEHVYLVWKRPEIVREQLETRLRQVELGLLATRRERDLWKKSASDAAAASSYGERLLVKFYRRYLRGFVGACRRLLLRR